MFIVFPPNLRNAVLVKRAFAAIPQHFHGTQHFAHTADERMRLDAVIGRNVTLKLRKGFAQLT